jgi:hypothetical protein
MTTAAAIKKAGVRFGMRAYPATLMPDPDGGFTITFRDVPEAITEGDTREEALLRAEDGHFLIRLGVRGGGQRFLGHDIHGERGLERGTRSARERFGQCAGRDRAGNCNPQISLGVVFLSIENFTDLGRELSDRPGGTVPDVDQVILTGTKKALADFAVFPVPKLRMYRSTPMQCVPQVCHIRCRTTKVNSASGADLRVVLEFEIDPDALSQDEQPFTLILWPFRGTQWRKSPTETPRLTPVASHAGEYACLLEELSCGPQLLFIKVAGFRLLYARTHGSDEILTTLQRVGEAFQCGHCTGRIQSFVSVC